jgi:hypothetical protein
METFTLSFNKNIYEFHYYEPKGKPSFNIWKNGETTQFNLIWDESSNPIFSGFNLYEEVRYEFRLVSLIKLKSPFDLSDIGNIFREIKLKKGIDL